LGKCKYSKKKWESFNLKFHRIHLKIRLHNFAFQKICLVLCEFKTVTFSLKPADAYAPPPLAEISAKNAKFWTLLKHARKEIGCREVQPDISQSK